MVGFSVRVRKHRSGTALKISAMTFFVRHPLYILSYLAYLFATEFIRPEVRLWQGLTGYQWASLVLIPVFLGLWIRDRGVLVEEG